MRAVFMGTPAFAVPPLRALVDVCRAHGGDVVLVVCQPDRPAGRGLALARPAVALEADALGLLVVQPTRVRDGVLAARIRELGADVALVAAYGRILPRDLLDAPRLGCFNLHASCLPKYRGAAPITWAIANGDAETGVDLMRMEEGLDTGPVYAGARTPIERNDTTETLTQRLSNLAADLVRSSLLDAAEGRLVARPQDHERATLAPMLTKEHGLIPWSSPARSIDCLVRGMQPWPTAWTRLAGKTLKIFGATPFEGELVLAGPRAPGRILLADRGGVFVACGKDGQETVVLGDVQLEGKRRMSALELVNGRVLAAGAVFDSA